MISINTFVSLEESLALRLHRTLQSDGEVLFAKIEGLLKEGEFTAAAELVNTLDLSNVVEENRSYITWITNLAMLFGASRVTARPGTSVVGLGHEVTMTHQAVNGFAQMVVNRGVLYLQAQALQLIALRKNMDAPTETPVMKAGVNKADIVIPPSHDPNQRVLLPFASFMDESGKAFFNMVSSLHTSRLSAYGFAAEADALGMTEYQINEQLDSRICPVCAEMHGKKFKVEDARRFLGVALRVTDQSEMKSLQPWPSQSKDSVAELRDMTPDDLVAKGWHVPPFHPRCRGLLGRVGKGPSKQDILDANVPEQGPYTATQDDFSALGYPATQEQVDAWNQAANVSPVEVAAAIQNKPLDDYLGALITAEDPQKVSGVTDLWFNPDKSQVSLATDAATVRLDGVNSMLTLTQHHYDVLNEETKATFKKLMQSLYTVGQDANLNYLSMVADGKLGYTLARGGFVPDYEGWVAIKADISKASWYTSLDESDKAALAPMLGSDAPTAIYDLVGLGKLGRDALQLTAWQAYLSVTDPDAVSRFLTYFGN